EGRRQKAEGSRFRVDEGYAFLKPFVQLANTHCLLPTSLMSPALASSEFLVGHIPVRVVLAHNHVFDNAGVAVFVNDLDVIVAARNTVQRERTAASFDDMIAQLVRTPGVLVRRREKELMYVKVGVVHDHELCPLRRASRVRSHRHNHHCERDHDRAKKRHTRNELFLHYKISFQSRWVKQTGRDITLDEV